MKAYGTAGEKGGHGIFTKKQCQVLDLLIEHKTSKEIARALGISPHTVDQRISLARARLGVPSRNELAARYRVMRKAPAQSPSDLFAYPEGENSEAAQESDARGSSTVDQSKDAISYQARQQDDDRVTSADSAREKIHFPTNSKLDYRVGPEVFEGSSGGLWRLGAIVATALLLVITILILFAIYDQLNDILT